MGLFGKKEEPVNTVKEVTEEKDFIERPKICLLDLPEESNLLKEEGYNVYSGSLGALINIPNKRRVDSHLCLLNFDYPDNLHEFDILIIDQKAKETIDYKQEDHTRTSTKGNSEIYLISDYPQTKFDPRPLAGSLMGTAIRDLRKRGGLIITFGVGFEEVDYETIKITSEYPERQGKSKYSNYGFLGYVPHSENKTGTQFNIENVNDALKNALENHKEGMTYHATFHHPEIRDEEYNRKPDPNFIPLIKNNNGDVISFFRVEDKLGQIVFPQIQNKGEFLKDLFTAFLPDMFPELFPFSTRFKWVEKEEYWLPNHSNLLAQQRQIEEEYQKKLEEVEVKIEHNHKQYDFLHEIITETGDDLVKAVEKFLHYLEFKEIKNVDEEKPTVKEEDLQVTLSDGLLVIEVKGIGGMPKDIDCNQISKIKYRRAKERNAFDVKALTVINHQRYTPPINRTNPPFTEQQINDAENDERSLITTWQLFNLYYEIETGLISKEDARKSLLRFGLVRFKPSNIDLIGSPKEIHYNGQVVIIDLTGQELKKGDKLIISSADRYTEATIVSLKQDDNSVDCADNGEVGIKLDTKVKKENELWIKKK